MSLLDDKKAQMKALRAKPSTATGESAGSNVIVGSFTTKPATPPSPDEAGGRQQVDKVVKDNDPPSQTDKQKAAEAMAQRARDVAGKFVSFRDENDNFHILHQGEALNLNSTHCVDVFREVALEDHSKLPKDSLELLQTLLRKAARAKPHKTVYRRIAKDGDAYLHDWGDSGRHSTRVDANGITVVQSGGVIFSRGKDYGELPAPVIPRDKVEAWEFIQPLLLGVPEPDHIPLIAIMTERLRCDTPHPILIFTGQEGAGKSSVAERCAMTIDPSNGQPPSVTHSERGFYSAAQTRHTLMMDNLSKPLGGDLEDSLCKSSCGDTIMIPELYTTSDSRTLRVFVAWIITGISNNIRHADALDRAWVIRVEKPTTGYRSPTKLRAEYKAALGKVLGALLFFLAARMRLAPGIEAAQTIQHRMVDLLVTGEAVAQTLGDAPGSFIAAVQSKRATAAQDWIKYDPFAGALVKCLSDLVKRQAHSASIGNWRKWSTQCGYSVFQVNGQVFVAATADAIHQMVASATLGLNGREAECIPKSAPAAADALDRIQNQMQRAGWTVKRRRVNSGSNTIWVFGAPPGEVFAGRGPL